MKARLPVICRLNPESIPDLVDIESKSGDPPWNEKLFQGEFENDCSRIYGLRWKGELHAFLVCHVVLDEAHILNVAVRCNLRSQGLGRALVEHVLQEFDDRSIRVVTLEVRRGNVAARALYEKLGFVEMGIREKYYRNNDEDALIMRLDVREYACSKRKANGEGE